MEQVDHNTDPRQESMVAPKTLKYSYSYSYSVDGLGKHTVLSMSISHHPFINLALKYTDATSIHDIFGYGITFNLTFVVLTIQ